MERCKNINRNRPILSHIKNNKSRNNLVTPEILVNEIWFQEEASGVKIIELNSSTDSSEESTKNCNHSWSYVNNGRHEEEKDNYTVNAEARRRRRMSMNKKEAFAAAYTKPYYYDLGTQSNGNLSETYEEDNYEATTMHHHMNWFTIPNNDNLKSDSSTDNENNNGVEIIELDNTADIKNWEQMNHNEVITTESQKQHEKRTIWIYSYKNRRLLSDNDFELVNIQSSDASTPSISDDEVKVDRSKTASRLGSPIPAAYIPRLDLSVVQTLSTVTEVSEHNKSHSKESLQDVFNLKSKNNWLTERTDNIKKIGNFSVVNWMALSPRERRRRSINTESEISSLENGIEREITYAEGNTQFEVSNESSKIERSVVQVQVDIHANELEITNETTHRSTAKASKTSEKFAHILPMKISFADADIGVVDDNPELDHSTIPSIDVSSKLNKSEITDPMEKLDCSNWISEEKIEKETSVYDYDIETGNVTAVSSSDNVLVDSASTRLWMRSLQLMKPPQWAEYLPITCSPPSLHLSLSLGSLNDKKSWFKRLTKCIKCCK